MTKTQYYTATSIDGFIADQDNSLAWLFEVEHEGWVCWTRSSWAWPR